jgi:hypothetical protein
MLAGPENELLPLPLIDPFQSSLMNFSKISSPLRLA